MSDCKHCGLGPMSHALKTRQCPEPENGGWGSTKYEPMTPEKQEGPLLFTDVIARWFGEWVERGQETEYSDEANWIEAELRKAYAQGAASRDAEVAELKAFTSQQTKGTLALIEDNGKLEAENKALKAEVERFKKALLEVIPGLPSHPGHEGQACVPRCPENCYRCGAEKALART